MRLESLIWEEMPPFAAHTPDALVPSFGAAFVTKAMKTCFRVIQSWIILYPRHLPEFAACGNCADFTGEQGPGDDQLVNEPVLVLVGFVQHSSLLTKILCLVIFKFTLYICNTGLSIMIVHCILSISWL